MRHALLLALIPAIAAGLVAAACTDSADSVQSNATSQDGGTTTPAPSGTSTSEPASKAPLGKAGTGEATGLPCDVQAVIEARCIACHAMTSPPPLLNYNDLIEKSTKDPTKTRAQVSVELLKSKAMPPAPAAPPEDDEIKAFEDWVAAGTAQNTAACTEPPPDGGAPPPGVDGGGAAGDGGCTSGKFYVPPDPDEITGAPIMEPGRACLECHQRNGGPRFPIAGTVYETLREPDRCVGAGPPPQLFVTVTDSDRPRPKQITMMVNEAGNFYTTERFRAPIVRAVVGVVGDPTKTRVMNNRITQGDCNACHTQQGRNGAPGRIMAP